MLIFRSYKIHGKNLPWLFRPRITKTHTLSTKTLINRQFLEDNFSSIPEISTFRLWEALGNKDIATALELFTIQQQAGIHPLRLLKFLARQIDQLWHVKIYLSEGQSTKQIASILKLHPFITEKSSNKLKISV